MRGNETKRLVKGALLLTLAGVLSKLLSAGYRIPLQNLTGDLGFYIYQQIYPLLGIALILSLYGFPSAISRMVSELKLDGKGLSLKSFYLPVFLIMLTINGIVFITLFLGAPFLSVLIGDHNLTSAYKLAAFIFLLIPFTSLIRGVFQGDHYMEPTAYSQVGEQFIRVLLIILVAYMFVYQKLGVYRIGEAAALASIAGAIIAIIILSIFLINKKPVSKTDFSIPWKYYLHTLLTLGLVASLNHMVLLIIQFADVFTLVPNLMKFGLPSIEAMETKGIFDRGQPLIQLGTVLGSSFALALIPAVSKRGLERNPKVLYENVQGGLLFSFYLAAGATIGLITIFPETNLLLFQNTKGTTSLQILAVAIFLSSIIITVSSILQGLGYFKRAAGFILFAFILKCVMNYIFVPWWGIIGSAVATVLSLLILCALVLIELNQRLPKVQFLEQINWWAFASAGIGMVVYILIIDYFVSPTLISSRFGLLVYVLFISTTGAIIYIFILLKGRAFTKRELSLLPFAPLLIRLHKGRNSVDS